ncbi:MAG: hypothetical protein KDF65_07820 [Anaerolineae bacterium]|nr:hypothetical protein [Anaerolineae bacterium]
MIDIAIKEVLDKLPVTELEESLHQFLQPMMKDLPDKRLQQVVPLAVRGIVGSETPIVTQMAQTVARTKSSVWAAAKRVYRFLENERFSHCELEQGLYEISQTTLGQEGPAYVVVAIDPVNFEKPYTRELEGVSTVYKSTPPQMNGQARLTRGYPAITATVVNTKVPAVTYANWFSYTTDFLSENLEIKQAIASTRRLLPDYRTRYVADAGLDDQKLFAALAQDEFVIRAGHLDRLVEVYNDRLDRWETEVLQDLVEVVPFSHTFQVTFSHARKTRLASLKVGWFRLRLPTTHQPLWVLVAYEAAIDRTLVLLTNVPLPSIVAVRSVYNDWRLRSRIEHGYRFDQEQGLDVEDMRVQTLERMKRLFFLVLAAAQFVFYLIDTWPPRAVRWIRQLGGKLGLANDLDGPYLVLRGLSAIFQTVATLTFLVTCPFPRREFSTYG